jgi:hypothetical protein
VRLNRADVPAFLDRIVDLHGGPVYGGDRAAAARECAVRVLSVVGLIRLPRRTIRRYHARDVLCWKLPKLPGYDSWGFPALASPVQVYNDPAVPACVPFADVELDESAGPGWLHLSASSSYGEASCRLGCATGFAFPLGSFTRTGN